jgi:hypothetical protein
MAITVQSFTTLLLARNLNWLTLNYWTLSSLTNGWSRIKVKVKIFFTTDGQLVSLSWCQAPIWGLRPHFYYRQAIADLLIWGAVSDERTGLPFTVSDGPRQCSHSRVLVPGDSWPYFTVSDSRLPNLEAQVPVFISPRNRVAQEYPQGLGSHFVASHDSQGYGGSIRVRLHEGNNSLSKWKSKLLYDWRYTANQFVLAPSPLRPTTRDFFQLNPCNNSPYVTSSLMRRWICLLWICLAFRQVYISHIEHVTENSNALVSTSSSVVADKCFRDPFSINGRLCDGSLSAQFRRSGIMS